MYNINIYHGKRKLEVKEGISLLSALTENDIFELKFLLITPNIIDFKPGQYVQLQSVEYLGRDSVMRAYSISSSPKDQKHIELIVRLVPDGICTTWVFDHLKEGAEVILSGPFGVFYLSDNDTPIVLMAGGSGMAPMHSILNYMVENNIKRNTIYFFGATSQKDLFYMKELQKFDEENEWFTFISVLSNKPNESEWMGERGFVTDVLSKYIKECKGYEAYLCGSPGMVGACEKALKSICIEEENIFYDEFA